MRKKRNFEEFSKSKDENSSNISKKNFKNQSRGFEKDSNKFTENDYLQTSQIKSSKKIDASQNIFCFLRKYMQNASLELLNLSEVTNQFVEKLSEINLHGKNIKELTKRKDKSNFSSKYFFQKFSTKFKK